MTDLPDIPDLAELGDLTEGRRLKYAAIRKLRRLDSIERKMLEAIAAEVVAAVLATLSTRSRKHVAKLTAPRAAAQTRPFVRPVAESVEAPDPYVNILKVPRGGQRKRQLALRQSSGLCTTCGAEPPLPGKSQCASCRGFAIREA